ncbi:MBL fold metallo-hydrolase [Bacillus salacetis]|uniref:MBL fold metallo-hydrolase n=1 Tax=Bacillus salacetis TaxID=2315464 RepID=UPI003B9E8BE8
MELTMFLVKKGDSFLLKDKDFHLLVDGGIKESDAVGNVTAVTNNIDVMICTHYDSDHIRGLLGLIKHALSSKKFFIKEIWLPEIFGRISVSKAKGLIIENINRNDSIKVEDEDGKLVTLTSKINVDIAVRLIHEIVTLSYHLQSARKTKIRWFSFTNNVVNKSVGNNTFGINCKELKRKIVPYNNSRGLILHLTKINQESLVFRYNDIGKPNVLFTADTAFTFIQPGQIVPITDSKSVVTTPHHGSSAKEHRKVYAHLNSHYHDFIFIRSSELHRSRPCPEYNSHPVTKRFCTRCNTSKITGTVRLIFNGSQWVPVNRGIACNCI